MAGPGHGAPGVLGPVYLEGTYSEIYPDKSEDAEGMQRFFKEFSFPGFIGIMTATVSPGASSPDLWPETTQTRCIGASASSQISDLQSMLKTLMGQGF